MKGKIFATSMALVLAASAWAGDDAWKSQPYTQWDAKAVDLVMRTSPWVKLNVVPMGSWRPEDSTPDLTAADVGSSSDDMTHVGGGRRDATAGDSSAKGAAPVFSVYWWSSRTLREAQVRGQVLKGTLTAAAGDAALKSVPDSYQVVVLGRDMKVFTNRGEDAFKGFATLKLHKSKTKLTPTKVIFQKNASGKVIDALFTFDRKTTSGQPTIPDDEKEVEFELQLGDSKLQSTFNLKQMVDMQGEDL
jgi:hypothetical protein